MTDSGTIDEPAPTIVGPQPSSGGSGRKMNIPRGLELLVTLAGISPEWHRKVLADPLAAAVEAGITLSDSERAVLASVRGPALEGMAMSFARRHGGVSLGRLAAGAAAAALLASTAYAGEIPVAPGGVRADEPPIPPAREGVPVPQGIRPDVPEEAPAVLWMTVLNDALAQAKASNRAVMAVFPVPAGKMPPADPNRGISLEEQSQMVCLTDSREFRAAVRNANLLAARVMRPVASPVDHEKEKEAYDKAVAAYEAALKKYGLEEQKLPAVVFIAPDGSELSKLVQPAEEAKLVDAIKAAPPLLAKWITEQRRREQSQPATDGVRPDEPVTKGSRPDVPGGKL